MRAVEYALLAVLHVVVGMLVYMFILQPITESGLSVTSLPGLLAGETVTVPDEVNVLRDEDGNIRPATTEEEVESLALEGVPGEQNTVQGWFQQIVDTLP